VQRFRRFFKATIPTATFGAKGLGIALQGNFIWIDNGVTAYKFNKSGGSYTSINFATGSPGITYDPERNLIWSSGWNDDRYRAYNPANGALVFTSAPITMSKGHDVSIGAGRIWVASEYSSPDIIYSIEIIGGAIDPIVECSSTFTDPGYTATDNCGTPTSSATGTVNTSSIGTYTITYTATDAVYTSTVTRTVTVLDRTAPVITCPMNITAGNTTGQCGAIFLSPQQQLMHANTDYHIQSCTGSFFGAGITTVTATANDGNGNNSLVHLLLQYPTMRTTITVS
jgi:hypothetical protein